MARTRWPPICEPRPLGQARQIGHYVHAGLEEREESRHDRQPLHRRGRHPARLVPGLHRLQRAPPGDLSGALGGDERLTIYLDTSAVNRQVNQRRGITASVVIGVLVGATMIASAVAAQVFRQYGPHYLARAAEVAFAVALDVAAVLVIGYMAQMSPAPPGWQE